MKNVRIKRNKENIDSCSCNSCGGRGDTFDVELINACPSILTITLCRSCLITLKEEIPMALARAAGERYDIKPR